MMWELIHGGLELIQIFLIFILIKVPKLRKPKPSPYYTDYVNAGLILRVYKPEYEFQAIQGVTPTKLLDRGTLSPFYDWVLIEK